MIGEVGLTEIGVFYLSLYFVFQDRDLCVTAPDSPGTHSKDQIGLQLTRDPLTSASQVLALKVVNTTTQLCIEILMPLPSKEHACSTRPQ